MKRTEWKARLDDALSGVAESPWSARQVLHRARKEEQTMKKKAAAGVLIAVLFLIAVMGAAAAASLSGWDVMQFLFAGSSREAPDLAYTAVSREAVSDGAVLRVESAVYDGRMLAFDNALANRTPDVPMYCRVENFTANGVRVWPDFTDDFDEQWLPGLFSDGAWQDGELILLPEEARGAEELRVEMTVALYRPVRPVYWMETFDAAEARQKAEEGYYVIAGGEGFVGYDEEEGRWTRWFMGKMTEDMGEYRTERLTVSFDLTKPSQGVRKLTARERYENARCTAFYETAEITPLGLYLTLHIASRDGAVWACDAVLTDGEGNALIEQDREKFLPTAGELCAAADRASRLARFCYAGVRAEDLPDTVSLTIVLSDGEKMIFPVQVR